MENTLPLLLLLGAYLRKGLTTAGTEIIWRASFDWFMAFNVK